MRIAILSLAAAVMLGACSADRSRQEAASALVEKARYFVESHQYDSALVVLDTLNIRYRDCLEQRREGTSVRLNALASMTRDSIASDELQLRAATTKVDSLAQEFKKVDIQGTEGYYVAKSTFTGSEMNSTGIQARVDDQGYCFVIATVYGRKIGLNAIEYEGVSADGQSIEVEGSEIMSVTQEPAESLFKALCNATGNAKIKLAGSKGSVDLTLNAKQLQAIRNTWTYAQALQKSRLLNIRLEKLERQLARLNDQLASQIPAE